jgi:hypothetical protein
MHNAILNKILRSVLTPRVPKVIDPINFTTDVTNQPGSMLV